MRLRVRLKGAGFLEKYFPVFNPYKSWMGAYWDFVLLVALSYVALVTPYTVAFVQDDRVDGVWVLDRMVDITFVLDMILRFNWYVSTLPLFRLFVVLCTFPPRFDMRVTASASSSIHQSSHQSHPPTRSLLESSHWSPTTASYEP